MSRVANEPSVVRNIIMLAKLMDYLPQAQLDRFMEYPKAAERMAEELDRQASLPFAVDFPRAISVYIR